MSAGSQPAHFQAFIKDHKNKNENDEFPLRPIASVRNTPIEKVDWLVSKILGQLVELVPTNIKNSSQVITLLESLNPSDLTPDSGFFSLDVINLYPSINIGFGIDAVVDFAKEKWDQIDNWGISIDALKKCLMFICYNYEIRVKNETFLQIKGCPMGAHFAPPFAIITMYKIETQALEKLRREHAFSPALYVRYIDDILIGPIQKDGSLALKILASFNAVNDEIRFTLEEPDHNNVINFLDISIAIKQSKIDYWWYSKPRHSQNSLRYDSFVPNHVKRNFIKNYVNEVDKKCSTSELKREAQQKLKTRLGNNGYSKLPKPSSEPKKNQTEENATMLQLDFISDSCTRKINKIIKKYDLKIRLVNKPAKFLKHCFSRKPFCRKHENCEVCYNLPKEYCCDDKFLVYKFTCKHCQRFYIGETCRPFKMRYQEHKRSLKSKNKISALAEHALQDHESLDVSINDFTLNIVKRCASPLETRLSEANAIEGFRPQLNRKHESI